MSGPRIGSLCSGYGGLDMGVQLAIGGTVAWHAETDTDASAVLRHHYPDLPNHGDLTKFDWSAPEAVDVLCAGFPCQPVSGAGKGLGVNDERWLFDDIVRGIGRMVSRPGLLVFENVPGLLTANGGHAMARVVHGMASIGYVGRWRTVRASDAGAPHRRERVFIVARDTDSMAWSPQGAQQGRPETLGEPGAVERALGPDRLLAADPDGERRAGRPRARRGMAGTQSPGQGGEAERQRLRGAAAKGRATAFPWRDVEPAIRRWERILGRPVPWPLDNDGHLNPQLSEWAMGLPEGHVTDVPISREAMHKALGNGVVPQQAALALRWLLAHLAAADVA